MPITATFLVRKEDVLALWRHYYAASPTVRRSRILIQITVPVLLVLIAALGSLILDANSGSIPDSLLLASPLLVVAVLWAGFYPQLQEKLLVRSSEGILSQPDFQKVFCTQTLSMSEKGISSSSRLGERIHYWSSVSSISFTSDYLFIYLIGRQGIVIPRGQIPDATVQEMKALAEQMTSKAASAAVNNPGAGLSLTGERSTSSQKESLLPNGEGEDEG